jgi:hypothetical protein
LFIASGYEFFIGLYFENELAHSNSGRSVFFHAFADCLNLAVAQEESNLTISVKL